MTITSCAPALHVCYNQWCNNHLRLLLRTCRRPFFDKRLSNEVEGDSLGDVSIFLAALARWSSQKPLQTAELTSRFLQEFKGYVFKIMGGQDKEGFPMKQGVLTPGRVRLLMTPGDKCFRGYGRKNGERRRKTVRGCIVSNELAVLNLMIVKKGMSASEHVPDARAGPWNALLHCGVGSCLIPRLGWLGSSQTDA